MNGARASQGKAGAALFALACLAFAGMWFANLHESALAVPAAVGWAGALLALRPVVAAERQSALLFAFAVMAFLIFFLHETYEYQGNVRLFPLIVGWTGVVLSALDIVSLTETRVGRAVRTFFGSVVGEPPGEGRTVAREAACIGAVGAALAAVWLVGFLIGSPLLVFLWMWLWGRKPIRHSAYGAVATLAFIWILFEVVLSYDLYPGLLVEWVIETIGA